MRYKALVLDLDGTTIPNRIDGFPSEKVTKAIARAREKIHVSIATSRPLHKTQPIVDHLALTGPCVINGGTQIYDPVEKKMIIEIPLDRSVILKIHAICTKYNVRDFTSDGVHENTYDDSALPTIIFNIFTEEVPPKMADVLVEEMKKLEHISAHKIIGWTKGLECVDVSNATATKLHGIVEIARILGIESHEMIGVGDGYNDFPLLMACGLKIAMGNAAPELKAIADFVAPTVDEDGVATVIEKFILNG